MRVVTYTDAEAKFTSEMYQHVLSTPNLAEPVYELARRCLRAVEQNRPPRTREEQAAGLRELGSEVSDHE